ncbi:MAG: hypothetical protein ACI8V4_003279, partial [Ilumatobacter sp.]
MLCFGMSVQNFVRIGSSGSVATAEHRDADEECSQGVAA